MVGIRMFALFFKQKLSIIIIGAWTLIYNENLKAQKNTIKQVLGNYFV